jgi:MFS family permease
VRAEGGYGAVWAHRPVRRLLVASLAGRVAFSMLPLGVVLFATEATGSTSATGALVAAFLLTSTLAPARGRIVDRHGPPALVIFAAACSAGLIALFVAGSAGAPLGVLLAVGALTGAVIPPLGPFTRAVWGTALSREDERLRQHVYALDSAGEESALIVAPLAVAAIVATGSTGGALVAAAAGLLAGTAAAARSELAAALEPAPHQPGAARARLPAVLWLLIAALLGPGAALGAVNVAVPTLARSAGAPARAGLLLSVLAIGTAIASLLAGRHAWRWPPLVRLAVLQALFAVALASAAIAAEHPVLLGVALLAAGAFVGAFFVTLYLSVSELTPPGAATRAFGWLVATNNGGIAAGAALAGAVISADGDAAGLWLSVACALVGMAIVVVAGVAR